MKEMHICMYQGHLKMYPIFFHSFMELVLYKAHTHRHNHIIINTDASIHTRARTQTRTHKQT